MQKNNFLRASTIVILWNTYATAPLSLQWFSLRSRLGKNSWILTKKALQHNASAIKLLLSSANGFWLRLQRN
jgi:hypothetical protein